MDTRTFERAVWTVFWSCVTGAILGLVFAGLDTGLNWLRFGISAKVGPLPDLFMAVMEVVFCTVVGGVLGIVIACVAAFRAYRERCEGAPSAGTLDPPYRSWAESPQAGSRVDSADPPCAA